MDGAQMNDNAFFKPTLLYKEFMILDLIEKDSSITQRAISNELGVAVSMINGYIDTFEDKGYIRRNYISTKTVEYFITKKGIQRKKYLNISYLNASQNVYRSAKENIVKFLDNLVESGYKDIYLYGAGEVAEILLQVVTNEKHVNVNVLGVIDDDNLKQGSKLFGYPIISLSQSTQHNYDGVLISSYGHSETILNKLLNNKVNKEKIIGFF